MQRRSPGSSWCGAGFNLFPWVGVCKHGVGDPRYFMGVTGGVCLSPLPHGISLSVQISSWHPGDTVTVLNYLSSHQHPFSFPPHVGPVPVSVLSERELPREALMSQEPPSAVG